MNKAINDLNAMALNAAIAFFKALKNDELATDYIEEMDDYIAVGNHIIHEAQLTEDMECVVNFRIIEEQYYKY